MLTYFVPPVGSLLNKIVRDFASKRQQSNKRRTFDERSRHTLTFVRDFLFFIMRTNYIFYFSVYFILISYGISQSTGIPSITESAKSVSRFGGLFDFFGSHVKYQRNF